ncbi:hypothetical protein CU098_010657 [Rhizopus stolonifer]|uniref:Uncharacterized protein n=1 Tax=Rhizopus stolonifer TaxID=4846 RepID=A0A367KIG4_RHIST|nr:hypothetical protein CU098_010657 [Rhizopus stolonifer]
MCTLQMLSAKIDTLQNDLNFVKSKLESMEGNTMNPVTIRAPTARPAVFEHPKNEDNTKKRLVVKDIENVISNQQPDIEEEDVSKLYGEIKNGADTFWDKHLEKVEKTEDGLSYRNVPHSEMCLLFGRLVSPAPTSTTAPNATTIPTAILELMFIMEDPKQFEGLEEWDDSFDEGKKKPI